MKVQKAVREETIRMAQGTALCAAVMLMIFWIGHRFLPQVFPVDYRIYLSTVCGCLVAIANFFMLGLTVQEVAADPDPERGRKKMQASYSRRMLMQGVWLVVSMVAPCFFWITGALPLVFPRITIFLLQITGQFKPEQKDGEND